MKTISNILLIIMCSCASYCYGQDFSKEYESFKEKAKSDYTTFRGECNKKYAEFLRDAWDWYEGKTPIPKPKDDNPIPPKPYHNDKQHTPIVVSPEPVKPIEITPQPKPIEPIREVPQPIEQSVSVCFYGITPKIRMPKDFNSILRGVRPDDIADGWKKLSDNGLNNTIRDCLETRIRQSLCDWAYLQFLDNLSKQYCSDNNSATLLMSFFTSVP